MYTPNLINNKYTHDNLYRVVIATPGKTGSGMCGFFARAASNLLVSVSDERCVYALLPVLRLLL